MKAKSLKRKAKNDVEEKQFYTLRFTLYVCYYA